MAPGHCSPSRKVVSKMTTRSLSDLVRGGHGFKIPCSLMRRFTRALEGSGDLEQPLSAQAQTAQPALRGR